MPPVKPAATSAAARRNLVGDFMGAGFDYNPRKKVHPKPACAPYFWRHPNVELPIHFTTDDTKPHGSDLEPLTVIAIPPWRDQRADKAIHPGLPRCDRDGLPRRPAASSQ